MESEGTRMESEGTRMESEGTRMESEGTCYLARLGPSRTAPVRPSTRVPGPRPNGLLGGWRGIEARRPSIPAGERSLATDGTRQIGSLEDGSRQVGTGEAGAAHRCLGQRRPRQVSLG
jgi:hypothetical protein